MKSGVRYQVQIHVIKFCSGHVTSVRCRM